MSNFADITKHALDLGLTIHPVKPRGKEPILSGWPREASRNPAVIKLWSDLYPEGNYGVVANDEYCILESDNAEELIRLLGSETYSEFETYTVQARGNRPHFYFRQTDESRELGNLEQPGIFEFKCRNRYVVGEGSIHPTGAVYDCQQNAPIVDFPAGLAAKLRLIRRGLSPSALSQLGEGDGRQGNLQHTVGLLWDGKKTREQMIDELEQVNQAFGLPKEAGKIASLVDWVMERPPHVKPVQAVIRKPWGVSLREAIEITKDKPIRTPYLTQGKNGPVVFSESSLNQIVAWRGLGKTNLALRLAGCLATGGTWLNYEAPAALRVAYVDGELPFPQLVERARSFCVDERGEPALDNVRLINPEILAGKHSIDLMDDRHFDELLRSLLEFKANVVFLDSQGTLLKGDAIKHEFQEARNRLLLELRLQGLCLVELHHTGKNQDSQRGRSNNDDLLDFQMYLKEVPERVDGEGMRVEVQIGKVRHYPTPTGGFEIYLNPEAGWGMRRLSHEEAVQELLEEGLSMPKIAKELDIHVSTVKRLKAKLAKSGVLKLNEKHEAKIKQSKEDKQ